jgi:hypothetical protein
MCGGSDSGDGGAQDRRSQEDARQAEAIARLNAQFGIGGGKIAPNRNNFIRAITQAPAASQANPTAPLNQSQGDGSFTSGSFTSNGADGQGLVNPFGFSANVSVDEDAYQRALTDYQSGLTSENPNKNARDALYKKFATDAKNKQLDELGREKALTQRDFSFDLARRGLTGGSRNIDVNRDITDKFNEGVLLADNNAQQVSNTARQNDERTRVGLIGSIRAGMSDADATTAALNGLTNNANQAQDQANSQTLDGFFNTLRQGAQNYQTGQQQQAYQGGYQRRRGAGGNYGGNVQSTGG